MNTEMKHAFAFVKPLCDAVMISPEPRALDELLSRITELKSGILQEMQLYVLFPVVTHLKSNALKSKTELQRKLVEIIKVVLERVTVDSVDIFIKYHTCLLNRIFDKNRVGMVADTSEELKLRVIQCLVLLMLDMDSKQRVKLFKFHVPMLAQTIFIAVHMAKLEKLRSLRLASMECVTAYTATHTRLTTKNYHIKNKELEDLSAVMCANILPGVLAALQEVATDCDNPGQAVVAAAINAMHRVLCMVMADKRARPPADVTMDDFSRLMTGKPAVVDKEGPYPGGVVPPLSASWFSLAGQNLSVITRALTPHITHPHENVRQELGFFCGRVLNECASTMKPSLCLVIDMLIALSHDPYPPISEYCKEALTSYFERLPEHSRTYVIDTLIESYSTLLVTLPRILNDIDEDRKVTALKLLKGYINILSPRPYAATLLGVGRLCDVMIEACKIDTNIEALRLTTDQSLTTPPPNPPWVHSNPSCIPTLRAIAVSLARSRTVDTFLDHLIDMLDQCKDEKKEVLCLINWIGSALESDPSLATRVLDRYLEEDMWQPIDGDTSTHQLVEGTLDRDVYDPIKWDKDYVPGLYEGAIEVRYTDIPLSSPVGNRYPRHCPKDTQRRLVETCVTIEGVGEMAIKLGEGFQKYMLRTLCLVLERVGSKYEMEHISATRAIHNIATSSGCDVATLIKNNADYFTYQVTSRLKKWWNSQSALRILSVVMECSDDTIMDCLYGIVTDVLLESCDKYHSNDLTAYLQVFLTFANCIRRWYPHEQKQNADQNQSHTIDLFKEKEEYERSQQEIERLIDSDGPEMSAEEMYKEDMAQKEEELLDYDDKVTEESPPPPRHITLSASLLRRCIHFLTSKNRDQKLLVLQLATATLHILSPYEDILLPLVHLLWNPLVTNMKNEDLVVVRRSFEVLVTMSDVSKDFIRSRTVKEVLPTLYKFLESSSKCSYLKDVGSHYRHSPRYKLQLSVMTSLGGVVSNLGVDGECLEKALKCATLYLSDRQPKPLQDLAVNFFKQMLEVDYGATWQHLRELCNNSIQLAPPTIEGLKVKVIVSTPYEPLDKSYKKNINRIFNLDV